MTQIEIIGNGESYQMSRRIEWQEIFLNGDFNFGAKTKINFQYQENCFRFENRHELFKFSEEIRGFGLDRLILWCGQYGFDNQFVRDLAAKNSIEIGFLKSIFLVYHWIELPLTDPKELKLENQIFYEFVVDWTNVPVPQQDIYFIPKELIKEENMLIISKLMTLNLLIKMEIKSDKVDLLSYFIPLVKPGVSKEYFRLNSDDTSYEAYTFWDEILKRRHKRLSRWSKTRF